MADRNDGNPGGLSRGKIKAIILAALAIAVALWLIFQSGAFNRAETHEVNVAHAPPGVET